MTRKEKDLKLLEVLGLKIGDKIKIQGYRQVHIYQIIDGNDKIGLYNINDTNDITTCIALIMSDWEKVKPSLKNKKCKDFDRCIGCPIYKSDYLDCGNGEQETLEEKYNKAKQELDKLRAEIYGDENGNN